MMTSILIVDDHPIVRRGLKDILVSEGTFVVYEASDSHEALGLVRNEKFDLVILDLDLPGMNGLELLKEIHRISKRIRVLILSVYPEDQFALRVLRAGAQGFVSKDTAPEELVTAIKKILKGEKQVSERVTDILLSQYDLGSETSPHERLSDREFEILCMFGEGRNIKEIADKLSLSPPTVSTYRTRILNKLEMKTTAELVRYAIENKLARPK
jgi:two-component system, NarL family, invasion response regulator UvrY